MILYYQGYWKMQNLKTFYPSESEEQRRFVVEIKLNYKDFIVFAIPNGGTRNKIEGMRLKNEGVLSGIPDLQIIMPNKQMVFIEMKKQKGGRLSDIQKEIISKINKNGFDVIIGYGYLDALEKFKNYLEKD